MEALLANDNLVDGRNANSDRNDKERAFLNGIFADKLRQYGTRK